MCVGMQPSFVVTSSTRGTSYSPSVKMRGTSYSPSVKMNASYSPSVKMRGTSYTPSVKMRGTSYTPSVKMRGTSYNSVKLCCQLIHVTSVPVKCLVCCAYIVHKTICHMYLHVRVQYMLDIAMYRYI